MTAIVARPTWLERLVIAVIVVGGVVAASVAPLPTILRVGLAFASGFVGGGALTLYAVHSALRTMIDVATRVHNHIPGASDDAS
jgi:preprotein translocase subunit SecY